MSLSLGLPRRLGGRDSACNAGHAGDLGSIPGQEVPVEEEMATYSSTLAWSIPWTEEPGELQSVGSQRVRPDLATEHRHTQAWASRRRGRKEEVRVSHCGPWTCLLMWSSHWLAKYPLTSFPGNGPDEGSELERRQTVNIRISPPAFSHSQQEKKPCILRSAWKPRCV